MIQMSFLESFLTALFAVVPTALLWAEYVRKGTVNGWLLALWIVCTILALAFTYGNRDRAGGENVDD